MLDLARRPFIGMVHLGPLPGAPDPCERMNTVIRRAVEDALTLQEGGADALLVENYFDAPFSRGNVPPVTVAAMTLAVTEVRRAVRVPIGVNVLRNDVVSAISIAHVCEAAFVRCNVYVGAMVTDQGIIEGAAREARMIIRHLQAQVQVLADVGVKHAAPLSAMSAAQEASDAVARGKADALIVMGTATGSSPSLEQLLSVKEAAPGVSVFLGSGVSEATDGSLLRAADGVLVGTALKREGRIGAPVCEERVRRMVARWRALTPHA